MAAEAVSRHSGRRHPVEWAYVNVDVGAASAMVGAVVGVHGMGG